MESTENQKQITIDFTFFDKDINQNENPEQPKVGILIVLNREIEDQNLFKKLIFHSDIIIGADGGANRIYQFSEDNKVNVKVDYITGDFDSIKPEIKNHYENIGTKLMYKES